MTFRYKNTIDAIFAIVVLMLLVLHFFAQGKTDQVTLFFIATFVVLGSIPRMYETLKALVLRKFGVDVIAALAIISALLTGDIVAAGVVFIMSFTGAFLERFAGERAKASLSRLLQSAPTVVSVRRGEGVYLVPVHEVVIGETVIVKQGEVVPLDGVVTEGVSSVDESMITGESLLKEVSVGYSVLSGSLNQGDTFTVTVSKMYSDSVFSGIVRLVKKAEEEKAPLVRMADRYSSYFTVFTLLLASAAFLKDPKLVTAVLVVATPCPLILAAPIAFIAGMSKSARNGIIVKYGGVFELVQKSKAFFFDKTGTVTLGVPSVVSVSSMSERFSEEDILKIAASLEQGSSHILAESIVEESSKKGLLLSLFENVHETIGKGVSGKQQGSTYSIGGVSFLDSQGVDVSACEGKSFHRGLVIFVSCEKEVVGAIHFSDTVRKNASAIIKELHSLSPLSHFVLLTGDKKEHAEEVGKKLGFKDIVAECLPEDKLLLVNKYESLGKSVVMIGDGVNDAPSLAKASVGVALSSHGATVATDIADVVIMVNDLEKIVTLVSVSKKTTLIAKQSMFFGMGLSVTAMLFALFGYIAPVDGAVLQEAIDVLMILNALRAL